MLRGEIMKLAIVVDFEKSTGNLLRAEIYDTDTGELQVLNRIGLLNEAKKGLHVANMTLRGVRGPELFCTPKNRCYYKECNSLVERCYYAFMLEGTRGVYRVVIGGPNYIAGWLDWEELDEIFKLSKNKLTFANAMISGNAKLGYKIELLDNVLNDRIKVEINSLQGSIIRRGNIGNKLSATYRNVGDKLYIEYLEHEGTGEYWVQDGIEGIMKYVSGINHLVLPKSVKVLGKNFAYESTDLFIVSLDRSGKLTEIPDGAFMCSQLRRLNTFEPLVKVGDGSFMCSKLEGVVSSNNLIEIGPNAFDNTKIEGVMLTNVHSIGENAFEDCKRLRKVYLSGDLTEIKNSTFSGCSRLKSIVIPKSVKRIGAFAFIGCTSLEKLKVSRDTKISKYAFDEKCKVKIERL